ncbi:hypothetical protein MOUN0_J08548 [Monosporozyma unispora]
MYPQDLHIVILYSTVLYYAIQHYTHNTILTVLHSQYYTHSTISLPLNSLNICNLTL